MTFDCEKRASNLLTPERIDNNIGHIKSNTVLCCYKCNCTRHNAYTHEEFKIKMEQETASTTERVWA
jgi:hypothetical protein